MIKSPFFKTITIAMTLVAFSIPAQAEKIVIFGATGNIGQAVVKEALQRGHEVIGVSRSPDNFKYTEENFTGVAGNPTDVDSVLVVTEGADAVISAVGGREAATPEETAMNQTAIAFSTAFAGKGEDGPNVVSVGGGLTASASLEELIEKLPPNASEGSTFRALFVGHWVAFETYQASDINWTIIAPPLSIVGFGRAPGEDVRTGEYRTSVEGSVVNSDGDSLISKSDLAVAIVDSAESGEHKQLKINVGY